MKKSILFLLAVLTFSLTGQAASSSGDYHPATEAATMMMTPTQGHPHVAPQLQDEAELERLTEKVRGRARRTWIFTALTYGALLLGILGGLSGSAGILVLMILLALGFSIASLVNLIGGLIALDKLNTALLVEPPEVAAKYKKRVSAAKIGLIIAAVLTLLGWISNAIPRGQ